MKTELDMNLLIVLVLLHRYKKIRLVAKTLGRTESAVSKHLTKLRGQFDDPLFVRVGSQFEPTHYMEQILPAITSGLESIKSISQYGKFEPTMYKHNIVIALPSILQYWVGDELIIDLIKTFPRAKINLLSWDEKSSSGIIEGSIDVGVHYFNPNLPKTIYQHSLGRIMPKIITSPSLSSISFKKATELPFFWLATKGASFTKPAILNSFEEKGINIKTVGTVDDVACLLNIIIKNESATVLHCVNEKSDEYNSIDFPSEFKIHEQNKIVANYRSSNKNHPLNNLIVKKIQKYLIVLN